MPLVGNAFDIDRADPLGGFVRMAQEYGPPSRSLHRVAYDCSRRARSS
jgi:hypothetical protein